MTPCDLAEIPNQKEALPRFRDLTKVKGVMRDGKVYGIPFCFDFDRPHLRHRQGEAGADLDGSVLWDPKYKGKVLAYDNGEHNFSFTALTMGIQDPFHLTPEQMTQVKAKLIELKKNVLSFYTTADEALQIYKNNDVALIWANYGQQQLKSLQDAGAHVAYINPKEGALAWLDTWAMTSGVKDKDLAEKWVNFLLQKKIGAAALRAHRFRQHRRAIGSAKDDDKLVWLEPSRTRPSAPTSGTRSRRRRRSRMLTARPGRCVPAWPGQARASSE